MRAATWSIGEASDGTPDAADDAALVAAARRDPQAFALLYDRYADAVYRYCLVRLGSRPAAEDVTAQVFLSALAALDTCRADRFAGWLFAIARNTIADLHRSRRPDRRLEEAEGVATGGPTPEDEAVVAESLRETLALLATLPEAQRQVVELRLVGLTGGQIAVALGRSVGAVRMLQLRAVRRLREAAGADRGGDER